METFETGDLIMVRDMAGESRPKRALGPVTQGGSFDVVWVCREDEWQAAKAEGREPRGLPWPAEDVHHAGAPA